MNADAPEPPSSELVRTVYADLDQDVPAQRRLAEPATMQRLCLSVERGHALPLVVETETGVLVARFALPGDLAIFASRDRQTLPARFFALLTEEKP